MIIGEIASHDFPENWPDLLETLLNLFQSAQPTNSQAFGALKCMSIVAEHFADNQLFSLFPKLFPYVMNVAKNANVRAKG